MSAFSYSGGAADADLQALVLWRSLYEEARHCLSGASRESEASAETSASAEDPAASEGAGGADEARRLVEAASGAAPAEFHRILDEPATERTAAHFYTMLQRRMSGEPLQYVVGSWGFRSLELMIDRRVLIPRPETEVVAGWAIKEAAQRVGGVAAGRQVTVVDLGTGAGAIGMSVAVECSRARVYASDVSPDALAVARANLAGLGRAAARVTLHQGDWFEALPGRLRGTIDVIVSNPPYVAAGEKLPSVVADWEPLTALRSGPTGAEALQQVVKGASQWLRAGGALITEAAAQRARESAEIFTAAGFSEVRVEPDLAGRDRVVLGRL
ncbi:MAG: peptide chain release factor N(5)-glutamine methyltransferase [Acidimicrobiaceae bacterium]|nr:peptide chain release factor N(5)-glutamine methyltransferase [Acidimicrobiaceae bacterium]